MKLIFGAGSTGRRVFNLLPSGEVIGFLDNDSTKWGTKIGDKPVLGSTPPPDVEYDEIIVASLTGMEMIREQLLNAGIPANKINCEYISTQVNARINFLRDFAELYQTSLAEDVCIAEGGVFQGEFAKIINEVFPKQKLYLFDTFEGFDERDVKKEHEEGFSIFEKQHLNIITPELVLGKMPHPENVVIRKGYFPETVRGLENERFFFVNLDFDLYNPTLDGLRFFFPRLVEDGLILIHDYYNQGYAGVKQALNDFDGNFYRMPVGDHCSIAVIKRE